MRQASKIQSAVTTTFSARKPRVESDRLMPTQTTPAETVSPARRQKESITCLPLYLASRDVGSQSVCCAVFESE